MSVSYNSMFSRPDDLRSITMMDRIGSGGFGTVSGRTGGGVRTGGGE